jgi:hypothetical protein
MILIYSIDSLYTGCGKLYVQVLYGMSRKASRVENHHARLSLRFPR